MTMLYLDMGNSRIKWALGSPLDAGFSDAGSFAHAELDAGLAALLKSAPPLTAIHGVTVADSAVVEKVTAALSAASGSECHWWQSAAESGGLRNGYRDPGLLGVDRWAAMVGAWEQASVVVVDAGTAITIDAVTADGMHLGGMIAPGYALLQGALSAETGQIREFSGRSDAEADSGPLGRSTAEAVEQGVALMAADFINRRVESLSAGLGDFRLLLTGGDAQRVAAALEHEAELRPHLVLEGVRRMASGSQSA